MGNASPGYVGEFGALFYPEEAAPLKGGGDPSGPRARERIKDKAPGRGHEAHEPPHKRYAFHGWVDIATGPTRPGSWILRAGGPLGPIAHLGPGL
jgi:hypothetical protein